MVEMGMGNEPTRLALASVDGEVEFEQPESILEEKHGEPWGCCRNGVRGIGSFARNSGRRNEPSRSSRRIEAGKLKEVFDG